MKKYIISGLIIAVLLLPVIALGQSAVDLGLGELETVGDEAGYEESTTLETIIGRMIKIVLSLLGLVAIILVIVGGFQWMTSGGNEDKIKDAKKLMGSALIGLIIIVIAYAAATFILAKLVTITTGT